MQYYDLLRQLESPENSLSSQLSLRAYTVRPHTQHKNTLAVVDEFKDDEPQFFKNMQFSDSTVDASLEAHRNGPQLKLGNILDETARSTTNIASQTINSTQTDEPTSIDHESNANDAVDERSSDGDRDVQRPNSSCCTFL